MDIGNGFARYMRDHNLPAEGWNGADCHDDDEDDDWEDDEEDDWEDE